jgi:hypothetical protein
MVTDMVTDTDISTARLRTRTPGTTSLKEKKSSLSANLIIKIWTVKEFCMGRNSAGPAYTSLFLVSPIWFCYTNSKIYQVITHEIE